MQRCGACGYVRWPPGPVCPECWAERHEWALLSGEGVVNTWVVFHRVYFPAFAEETPYNVAEIELAEGPRYLAPIRDCPNDAISRGMSVGVRFEHVSETLALPVFEPR
jgi:uncharacterized OB-fold protein